jgi:hypothetical protein
LKETGSFQKWFIALLGLFTLYDFAEHVGRPDGHFEKNIPGWLLFSLASFSTLSLIFLLGDTLALKTMRKFYFVGQFVSLFTAFYLHINLTGPVYNRLFIPEINLVFYFHAPSFLVGLSFFLIVRIAHFLFTRIRQPWYLEIHLLDRRFAPACSAPTNKPWNTCTPTCPCFNG